MKRSSAVVSFVKVVGVLSVCSLAVLACGDDGGSELDESPYPTEIGTPNGTLAEAVIGAAGGEVSSSDGRLTLRIPAGALSTDVTIGIQPITGNAPGAIGLAYRLTPESQTFGQPVALEFSYSATETEGTGPQALGVTFQRADLVWQLADAFAVDESASTIAASIDRFSQDELPSMSRGAIAHADMRSDWGLIAYMKIKPARAVVAPLEFVSFGFEICWPTYSRWKPGVISEVLGSKCQDVGSDIQYLISGDWSIGGIVGGNDDIGHFFGKRYGAPEIAPEPNTYPIDVEVWSPAHPEIRKRLFGFVTIVDEAAFYAGSVEFIAPGFGPTSASGIVTWRSFEDLSDVMRLRPSGILNATVSPEDCDPVTLDLTIDSGTVDAPAGTLTVYKAGSAFGKAHDFGLSTVPVSVTFSCGEPRQPVTVDVSANIIVGICSTGFAPIPYEDLSVLAGTYTCPATSLTATWSFERGGPP